MSDPKHFLDWNGSPHPDGWKLRCDHRLDEFFSTNEDGSFESTDCWLLSWWEELGMELVTSSPGVKWPGVTPIPLEVRGDPWRGDVELVPWLAD